LELSFRDSKIKPLPMTFSETILNYALRLIIRVNRRNILSVAESPFKDGLRDKIVQQTFCR
jgi:hypothetical protein